MQDLLAGVDHVIKMGVADPDRLGVGGWSYGGILTDYLIASDTRFKAATSGAGTAFTVAFYGTDQYIIQYDYEIGPPWNPKAWETYVKISYPFLHADRIQTPTLFLGGERDFNVPVQGSQQMYQALRSLGIDTQLIIYPNENHGIQRPSYQRDRMERYLAWYDKYVKKAVGALKHLNSAVNDRKPGKIQRPKDNLVYSLILIVCRMRVFATSDLQPTTKKTFVAQADSDTDYRNDTLIVAGDISDRLEIIRETLSLLRSKFRHLLFTPGNHELWVRNVELDPIEKFQHVLNSVRRAQCSHQATAIRRSLVVPLFSWYDGVFDRTRDETAAASVGRFSSLQMA